MTLGGLRQILSELADEVGDNSEVWLSSDEEGNDFLPMLANQNMSISIDKDTRKVVFFPSHR
jgi:hypothetical protein